MFRLKNKKGQNTAEYAILIALIVGAAVAMQTYVKRGLQGRVKDAVDSLASGTTGIGTTEQYEPYYLESSYDVTTQSKQQEEYLAGGSVERTIAAGDEETRRATGGYQEIKTEDGAD